MTVRLYIETNFLMSYATGRDPKTTQIFEQCPVNVERVMPSCCLMEALATLEDEQKRHQRQIEVYRQGAQEAERHAGLPGSARLAAHLREVITHATTAFAGFRSRLLEIIDRFSDGSSIQLLNTTTGHFLNGFEVSGSLDPTDQLILTTILDDAQLHPASAKILLTENRRCFFDDVVVWQALQRAGLQRYFARPANFLEWFEARAES